MIYSEYTLIDLGNSVSTVSIPIYTDNSSLKILSKPDWVEVSPSGTISVASNLATITISTKEGVFTPQYDSSIVISDASSADKYTLRVIWTRDSKSLTLDEIADIIHLSSEGTYIEDYPRHKILMFLKKGLRYLGLISMASPARFEAQRDDAGRIFVPDDLTMLTSVYAVDNYGRLGRLYSDDKLNYGSVSPIKDENFEYVLDSNGYWIKAEGLTTRPDKDGDNWLSPIQNDINRLTGIDNVYSDRNIGIHGVSGGKKTQYGQYRYVKEGGYIFIQDSPFEEFVIEYISDPIMSDKMKTDNGLMRIPLIYTEAIQAWVYSEIIKPRYEVPMNEKIRAQRDASVKVRLAQRMAASYDKIIQALKTRTNIHKG